MWESESGSVGLYLRRRALESLSGCARARVELCGAVPECRSSPGLQCQVCLYIIGCLMMEGGSMAQGHGCAGPRTHAGFWVILQGAKGAARET